jgi:hypothetical protein
VRCGDRLFVGSDNRRYARRETCQLDGRARVRVEKVDAHDEAATNGSAISSPPHHLFDRLRRLKPFRFKPLQGLQHGPLLANKQIMAVKHKRHGEFLPA